MREYIKKRCFEALDTLAKTHIEIVKLAQQGQKDAANDVLTQCQQVAIYVGGMIDKYEREDTEEVHLLEQYCEQVWRFSEAIQEGAVADLKEREKGLTTLVEQVSAGISSHFPTKREVVFLPYQASMWDSLESAWKKEKEDPNTDVFVVPIPYYDKKPDGSFGKIHFDGMNLPKYLEFTPYNLYDIEERHPERIYIHNPYDEYNFVTSVAPEYYSSELKDQTDELIYIPYFVLWDIDPKDPAQFEKARTFVECAAVLNAHRVIVQSETWRKVYIDIMSVAFADRYSRDYWERKIEAEVSSKIERVKQQRPEDYDLPEEWLKLIKRTDGTRKKIILYNTGIVTITIQNEKYVEKIKRVLDIFKKNSDNAVLLWRPHPLAQTAIASMRPEMLDEYKKVINEYREAGWGILDESPELHRALAVSDAYYGDDSSLVVMYKQTGRPIMIQNYDV